MGQYYWCLNTTDLSYINPLTYDNGLKLGEHAFLDSEVMRIVENLLMRPGCDARDTDPKDTRVEPLRGAWFEHRIVWAGDYGDVLDGHDCNRMDLFKREGYPFSENMFCTRRMRYIINHDKKQFVDKKPLWDSKESYPIHPLPLLTHESSELGICVKDEGVVGAWANCSISTDTEVPPGFTEIAYDFGI